MPRTELATARISRQQLQAAGGTNLATISRASRAGRLVAASRQHQQLEISLSTSSPRLTTVRKKARAPSIFSAMTSATTVSWRNVG